MALISLLGPMGRPCGWKWVAQGAVLAGKGELRISVLKQLAANASNTLRRREIAAFRESIWLRNLRWPCDCTALAGETACSTTSSNTHQQTTGPASGWNEGRSG